MVYERVSLRVNRRIAMDYLGQLRKLSKPRLMKNAACQKMHQLRQVVTMRHSLAQWSHSVAFLKQMINVTEQLGLYKRT